MKTRIKPQASVDILLSSFSFHLFGLNCCYLSENIVLGRERVCVCMCVYVCVCLFLSIRQRDFRGIVFRSQRNYIYSLSCLVFFSRVLPYTISLSLSVCVKRDRGFIRKKDGLGSSSITSLDVLNRKNFKRLVSNSSTTSQPISSID